MKAAPMHIRVLIPRLSSHLLCGPAPPPAPTLIFPPAVSLPLTSLRLVGRTCLIGVTRFLSSLQKLMGLFFSNPAFNQAQLVLSLLFLMLSQMSPIAFSSVQFSCSVVSDSATPWTAACQASLSITNSQSLLRLMSIELVMPSNHLILCCPLLFLPSIFPSIRVFSDESVLCIRWPKYWSFSFNISPSNDYSGLISFRMDWLDLLAVQGTLKSLLQHHSSKASIFRRSAFFMAQLSHPYIHPHPSTSFHLTSRTSNSFTVI